MLDLTFVLQCQFELQYCLYRKVRGTDINDIRCKSFAGLKICSFVTHTVNTEISVTNFFCLHFSEHAQWDFLLCQTFGQNICGYFLQYMWIILTLMHKLGVPI